MKKYFPIHIIITAFLSLHEYTWIFHSSNHNLHNQNLHAPPLTNIEHQYHARGYNTLIPMWDMRMDKRNYNIL